MLLKLKLALTSCTLRQASECLTLTYPEFMDSTDRMLGVCSFLCTSVCSIFDAYALRFLSFQQPGCSDAGKIAGAPAVSVKLSSWGTGAAVSSRIMLLQLWNCAW